MKGMVKVRFRVNKDGTLSRFTILKSLTKEQDEKAIEIIRGGPNWMPKINDGFVSKQWVTQDITF
jgi:TonB family protein